MRKDGFAVSSLHGTMKQKERDTTMNEFRAAKRFVYHLEFKRFWKVCFKSKSYVSQLNPFERFIANPNGLPRKQTQFLKVYCICQRYVSKPNGTFQGQGRSLMFITKPRGMFTRHDILEHNHKKSRSGLGFRGLHRILAYFMHFRVL